MKFPDATNGSMDSNNYLRLQDKESIRGVFRGDPYLFRTHWVGKKSSVCVGEKDCQHCKAGIKSGFRFRINFVVKEGETYTPKIWEQGWTVYTQLKGLHESDYNLEKTLVRISRTGSGMNDTSYTVLPLPNGAISDETNQKIVKEVTLHELNLFNNPDEQSQPEESKFNESDIPF